jgi:hypothetical protein
MKSGSSARRRAAINSFSWGWISSLRPFLAVVQRKARGQVRHRTPNTALLVGVIATVSPAGQVTVPATVSMAKSSLVKPPGTAARSGIGLMVWVWPPERRSARV